jgi:hypothetical protein
MADTAALPASLRLLKGLVIALLAVMILGIGTITVVLIIRLTAPASPDAPNAAARLPANISLPANSRAAAVTFGEGWIAVVTSDNRILIYDAESGALRQAIAIDGPAR